MEFLTIRLPRRLVICDHQQSWGAVDGTWKGPRPSLLMAADFQKQIYPLNTLFIRTDCFVIVSFIIFAHGPIDLAPAALEQITAEKR